MWSAWSPTWAGGSESGLRRSFALACFAALAAAAAGCGSVAAGGATQDGGRDGPAATGRADGSMGGSADREAGVALAAGLPCESAAECDSGFCADGVCCGVPCTGACVACNQPEQLGTCAPVPAGGEDLHGVCKAESAESCGQSGFCNGQGGCAKHAAGTVCRPSSCTDPQHFVPPSLCDGDGTCQHGTALSCSPSTCAAGACLGSCTGDDTCVPPQSCVSGSCGPKGLGQDCVSGAQCGSGFCVDGVCCDGACAGRCSFCANPEARGKCSPSKAGAVDPRAARGEKDPAKACLDQGPEGCGQNGRCDGQGGCQRYADGTTCRPPRCDGASNSDVAAGTCAAGACRVPGPESCAPFQGCSGNRCRESCEADGQCAGGLVCLAGGRCGKRGNGEGCDRAAECASGVCAQGRCCASACTASCKSCALPGQEGTCANVGAGGADPTGACRDDGCSNGCDGGGGCRREPSGTMCGPNGCGPGNGIVVRACNGAGVCEMRPMPGPACGRCGGVTLCDGSCSKPTPGNLDAPCGKCGGKVRCDGSCSVTDPSNLGASCGNAGKIDCSGGCKGPLFRLLNSAVNDHFYTMSAGERDTAVRTFGYVIEGTACQIYEGEVEGTVPLFRLFHGPTGDHFYTASAADRDTAVRTFGYAFEGITGYVHPRQVPGTIPLFRLYHSGVGDHFYTTSANERDNAIRTFGYIDEGTCCFVFP
jgi:hypothetical protein